MALSFMNNINLIGYRGSGKTAVGRKLAKVLRWPFIDSDEVIVDRIKCCIDEFVGEQGWDDFRWLESTVLEECCQQDKVVLATGGGVVLARENRSLLQENGTTVWLQANLETTLQRLENDPQTSSLRPPLSSLDLGEEIVLGLREREPLYREIADFIVQVDRKSVEDIVQEIVTGFGDING